MTILLADYILTMDFENPIIKNGAVVFDDKIVEITADQAVIGSWKKQARVVEMGKNSVVLPGLTNAHTHLEFSSNKTDLEYGNFIGWLSSVMEKREEIIGSCNEECHKEALKQMLLSGTTTVGAVSSYGFDLVACTKADQRIVFFNELIGSNPATLDALYADFVSRYENSARHDSAFFKASVAIHSPYSVHPVLLKKVLSFARNRGLPVSAHFMESRSERKWLDSGTGSFKAFFERYLKVSKPTTTASDFLASFAGVNTLFVHAVQATTDELDLISQMGASVVHCPVSNRLLGVGLLDLEALKNREISYMVATDGLSSNRSLNLFDELRSALFMHEGLDLALLARDLLRSVTSEASKALDLENGQLKEGKFADMIGFRLPAPVDNPDQLYLQTILHAPQKMERIFINGDEIDGVL